MMVLMMLFMIVDDGDDACDCVDDFWSYNLC